MNMNLPKPPMGNQRGRKHSDLQIAEIIAMHELGAGYVQINRLTKVHRSTIQKYIKGQRAAALIHSPEFQQEKDRIKKGLRNNPAWSRQGVAETKAEARQRLRAERQQRLADETIPHTPQPTVAQVARAKAEVQMERNQDIQRESPEVIRMHNQDGQRGVLRQNRTELRQKQLKAQRAERGRKWMQNLAKNGVPASAPKHVQDRFR